MLGDSPHDPTSLGKVANAVARLSARYLRAIADQIGRVVRRLYAIYFRFELFLVAAVTDLILFIWALRSFVLLLVLQAALVVAALRWPVAWLPAIGFAVLL